MSNSFPCSEASKVFLRKSSRQIMSGYTKVMAFSGEGLSSSEGAHVSFSRASSFLRLESKKKGPSGIQAATKAVVMRVKFQRWERGCSDEGDAVRDKEGSVGGANDPHCERFPPNVFLRHGDEEQDHKAQAFKKAQRSQTADR